MELPVGASEDRLVGSLDVERALTEGVKAFEPGLLAAAHRGVLYVDEVNLLHDHTSLDLLLDAAALGTCYVERESVSVPSRGPLPARGHHEPGGGRAAPPAPRPVRADGRGEGVPRPRRTRRGGAAAARLRHRPRGVRGAVGR
ncbi:hypothetical protein [Nonomuraea rubra]|uniref:hypothetical protein n=1 Tax=Nonomuraea rubra TaxID=46180 RepID=UPI003CD0BFAC